MGGCPAVMLLPRIHRRIAVDRNTALVIRQDPLQAESGTLETFNYSVRVDYSLLGIEDSSFVFDENGYPVNVLGGHGGTKASPSV